MKSKLNIVELELWQLVQKINKHWYTGNPQKLNDFFHPEVVFNSPDFKHRIAGKMKCIQTYIDFIALSEIISYSEHSPAIKLFNNTAIITYGFEMGYNQKNTSYHETGTDILVF